jgi:hypothetical protein
MSETTRIAAAKARIVLIALRLVEGLRSLLRAFQKTELSYIEDKDLTDLIKKIGRWDDFLNGNLHCHQCERTLTLENLSGFLVKDGNYQFLCDSQTCLRMAAKS